MIAECPKCSARYRVDEARVGPEGARLRCARCEAIFRIRPPAPATVPSAPASRQQPPPLPTAPSAPVSRQQSVPGGAPPQARPPLPTVPSAPVSRQQSVTGGAAPQAPRPLSTFPSAPVSRQQSVTGGAPPPQEPTDADRERLVLVADSREDTGKGTASALTSWGLQAILVHDGVEAMMNIQRALPRVVILDAALPKMHGFQVCEVIKRNESLRDTRVVLVGAMHDRDQRPPSDLYGADVYLEPADLPEGLQQLMARFGMPTATAPAHAPTPPDSRQAAVPASAPGARPAAPGPAGDALAAEREKAERLARIVVSDIVLYQGDKFDAGIRAGNLLEALDSEIEEGRNFFRQRIDEEVRNERDFLVDELMRVARERGAT